ncbi:MAG: hypothetical protein RR772_06415, partial [Gordonibacter sp.]
MTNNLAKHSETATVGKFTRGADDGIFEAKFGRTDAVNTGIVKASDAIAKAELKGVRKGESSVRSVLGRATRQAGAADGADAGDQAANNVARQTATALQSHRNMRSAILASTVSEMDEADETGGVANA